MTTYLPQLTEKNIEIIQKSNDQKELMVFSCDKKGTEVFVGQHIFHRNFEHIPDDTNEGNTILVSSKAPNGKHELSIRYIGPLFHFTFTLMTNDKIINYFSQIGNDKYNYPVLETSNRVYFLSNQLYINKSDLLQETNIEDIIDGYNTILKDERYIPYLRVFRKKII